LVGAGCAGKGAVTANIPTPPGQEGRGNANEPAKKPAARQLEVAMTAQGAAGFSGKALLVEQNDQTKVMINLDGGAGMMMPAHIHLGACPKPGDVKWTLADVVSGKSVTLVQASFDEVLAGLPLAINVHKSATEIGTYTSCGDILSAKVTDLQPGAEAMMEESAEAKAQAPGLNVNAAANVDVNVNAGLNVNGPLTAPREIRITAHQFTFTPSEVRVKLGEKIRLVAQSTDVTHGLSIPAFNVNLTLEAGKEATAEFVADQKGTFPFFCNTFCGSGHSGMRGSLIVE
ncbi:MAG TPA: cupredoxin domain-containing protein, partial [Patescibacteria group bacterium]|nr:cupredoxin domain-containing protein [Patescibacteria group bacterium]